MSHRIICPLCEQRTGGHVNPRCPLCEGLGTLFLGSPRVQATAEQHFGSDAPFVLALAVRNYIAICLRDDPPSHHPAALHDAYLVIKEHLIAGGFLLPTPAGVELIPHPHIPEPPTSERRERVVVAADSVARQFAGVEELEATAMTATDELAARRHRRAR